MRVGGPFLLVVAYWPGALFVHCQGHQERGAGLCEQLDERLPVELRGDRTVKGASSPIPVKVLDGMFESAAKLE
jgi:hypothetical protein